MLISLHGSGILRNYSQVENGKTLKAFKAVGADFENFSCDGNELSWFLQNLQSYEEKKD